MSDYLTNIGKGTPRNREMDMNGRVEVSSGVIGVHKRQIIPWLFLTQKSIGIGVAYLDLLICRPILVT
ncbi:MAG: hypothetical protein AAGI38_21515 [Bacteroidota bacterium]